MTSARGLMFAHGCIQAIKCNKKTGSTGITTHDRRQQRGLDPTDKSKRVKNFVGKMRYLVGVIAHSCGARHLRALERYYFRIVQSDGRPASLDELFSYPENEPERASKVQH